VAAFIRIKHYIINMDALTYIRVGEDYIDFGFSFPTEKPGGQNFVHIVKGKNLSDEEFKEIKEFVFGLPEPDRVILI
jgi:hypothetical protein